MNNSNSKTKLGLWLSTFISIIGLILIVLLSYIVEKTVVPNINRGLLTLISLIIAIIPPFLWLTIFYRQDRLNPEPKSFVFKTLILGALVQKAVYTPILSFVFPAANTGITAKARDYIITIILVAIVQEAVKLLSVRYSIYPSKEFDEKIDGIIYGSALGLGFAAMTSIDNILSTGGALLSNVTSLVVIETFAHASITGLSCYVLGVSKQKKFNILRLPSALVLASALNAVTQFLLNAVTRNGFKVNYILGLIPAAIVAVLVFTVLVLISSRNEKEGSVQTEILEPKKAFAGIVPVWAILILTLGVSFYVGHYAKESSEYSVNQSIQIQYPSNWIQLRNEEDLFRAANMLQGGGQEYVSIKKMPLNSMMSIKADSQEIILQNAAAAWSIKAGMNYRFYQAEKGYFLNTNGKETYVIDYVYISNSQSKLGDKLKPSIGYGRDILAVMDEELYIITLSSDYERYIKESNVFSEVQYTFIRN